MKFFKTAAIALTLFSTCAVANIEDLRGTVTLDQGYLDFAEDQFFSAAKKHLPQKVMDHCARKYDVFNNKTIVWWLPDGTQMQYPAQDLFCAFALGNGVKADNMPNGDIEIRIDSRDNTSNIFMVLTPLQGSLWTVTSYGAGDTVTMWAETADEHIIIHNVIVATRNDLVSSIRDAVNSRTK